MKVKISTTKSRVNADTRFLKNPVIEITFDNGTNLKILEGKYDGSIVLFSQLSDMEVSEKSINMITVKLVD